MLRVHPARTGEPRGADPERVGPAHPVGVVIRVVHADLQQQRDGEREQAQRERERLQHVGDASADGDGGDRERQRTQAGARHPVAPGDVRGLAGLDQVVRCRAQRRVA